MAVVPAAARVAPTKWRRVVCGSCKHQGRYPNGAWLAWKRQKAGVDQQVLADLIDVSRTYLSNLEHNLNRCPSQILEAYEAL